VSVTPAALAELLTEATGGRVLASADEPERPLRELGLDSGGWVSFLALVTARYGHEWDDGTPPEALVSLGSVARFLTDSAED